ncbi:hypothetical protein [Natronococcus sp. A-GB7]|uniref:hypothetical protein n=1 Tax=Natronococcus sp. A-GB7 TaxID=3037649 RepID=UPI00241CBE8A|nr:hypothetical protein [Natronococcus sp. A-GB7]MDG5819725.1 hypothetical protein [Natronococcus sp. A-GB7]
MRVVDPYERVDWTADDHHLAQLHVHPNYGDKGTPAEVIDAYHELGYTILPVQSKSDLLTTDGEHATAYPWTELAGTEIDPESSNQDDPPDWTENRDPEELGMVAIESVEIDRVEHMTHFFGSFDEADPESQGTQFHRARASIETTERGITGLAHPGRYLEHDVRGDWHRGEWERYDVLYRNRPRFFGLEVFNGAFHPDDRILWDDLLTKFAPQRQILGTAVDDATTVDVDDESVDRGRTVFLMSDEEFEPGHESGAIYDVWLRGQSYFSQVQNSQEDDHLRIERVEHDERAGTLTVEPDDWEWINWVADGEPIHADDETLEYDDYADEIDGYVRFEAGEGDNSYPSDETWTGSGDGPRSVVCTQPFLTTGTLARVERS